MIGIPTLAAASPQGGAQAQGIGFAIPSNLARDIATADHRLRARHQLAPGGPGRRGRDRPRRGRRARGGVGVVTVTSGGAAERAGLRPGDVIKSAGPRSRPRTRRRCPRPWPPPRPRRQDHRDGQPARRPGPDRPGDARRAARQLTAARPWRRSLAAISSTCRAIPRPAQDPPDPGARRSVSRKLAAQRATSCSRTRRRIERIRRLASCGDAVAARTMAFFRPSMSCGLTR